MNVVEAIIEALRLAILVIGYALEEAKKHAQAVTDEQSKRIQFEAAVARALIDLKARSVSQKTQTDEIDDAADAEARKPYDDKS